MSKLNKKKAAESLDLLGIFQEAELDILVTIEATYCFIQVVLCKAGLWHADQELSDETADS